MVSSRTSLFARFYGDASQEDSRIRGSTFIGCLGSQPNGCIHTSNGTAQWFGTELQATVKWLADLSMSSMVGFEGRVRRATFKSGISDFTTGAPVDEFGAFRAVDRRRRALRPAGLEPDAALTLNGGGRWDFDISWGTGCHRAPPRPRRLARRYCQGGLLRGISRPDVRGEESDQSLPRARGAHPLARDRPLARASSSSAWGDSGCSSEPSVPGGATSSRASPSASRVSAGQRAGCSTRAR